MSEATPAGLVGGGRQLAGTDLVASRMGYGAMELMGAPRARDLSESVVARLLNRLIDSGVTYVDTSIDYGLSETLIGKTIAHRRDEIVLASKCACQVGVEGVGGAHEKHIYTAQNVIAGVEQSLRRLRTDHLDVVQVHGSPTLQKLEEGGVIAAMEKLRDQGKVRVLGISARLPLLADFVDVPAFTLFQVPYSPLQRQNEDVIAAIHAKGKHVVARGVTGRGAPAKDWATRPIGTEAGEARALWERAGLDDLLDGLSRTEFMIRFVLANPAIDVALVATASTAHLDEDIAFARRGPLPDAVVAEARRRLDAAGGGAGQGRYASGGPSPVL